MMFSLKGKKALVTGGSRGIGRGIVLALAEQGADIAINYHSNSEKAEAVAEEVKKMGQEAWVLKADVSKGEEVKSMFDQLKVKWEKLDILVNNAGILAYAAFEEISEESWDKIIDTNLKGQFLCSQQAVKLMGAGSKIINIASIASGGVGVGVSHIAHYTASKGGIVALTENMALDLAPKGINVNSVAPGGIESDMTKAAMDDPELLKAILVRVPKGRLGKPKEIGAAVSFLASDEADYITGVVLYVDGGYLAG